MPPAKGPLWEFFIVGKKQNSSQNRAHCRGCIKKERPVNVPIELDDAGNEMLSSQSWVVDAMDRGVGAALGKKSAMIAHILGKGGASPCPNASSEAKKAARGLKGGGNAVGEKRSREENSSSDEDNGLEESVKKKRALHTCIQANLKQSKIPVLRGIDIPFKVEHKPIIQNQFLNATISANLPDRWVEDPEVIKLFLLFRSTAVDVIPSRKQIGGPLLGKAYDEVLEEVRSKVQGKYATLGSDGWKDESRDSVKGVNLTCDHKPYLTDLILATGHKKDGKSMCQSFEEMIDKSEEEYKVIVVAVCCDNDGGSARGRKDLVLKRPWLFGLPCLAHQFQLILGDYFKENPDAAQTAEEATDLIGWLLNHQLVRTIFNEVQAATSTPPGVVLAFLVANMTRWNTHFIAFDRLLLLQQPMRQAVFERRADIIAGQVGAESNPKKKAKLTQDATTHIDLIDDGGFWKRLKAVVDDIEPIVLGVNMNQTDSMRLDQALLTLAGIFLHFKKHTKTSVAKGMMKRVEARWKALDQPLFITALILNPFEGISRFGPQANALPFAINDLVLQLYRRVKSRPAKVPRSPEEQGNLDRELLEKEKEVSDACFHYLSGTGPFLDWEQQKENFRRVKGDDPIAMWQQYLKVDTTKELADLAILILSISATQAGMERTFSDLKIKKTRLRNRIKLPRLKKMSMVGNSLRGKQKKAGYIKERAKRKHHAGDGTLLAVPRYDLPSDSDDEEPEELQRPLLVKSSEGWRKEMAKWIKVEQERDDVDEEEIQNTTYGRRRGQWLPRSLELLFGGRLETSIDEQLCRSQRRLAYTEEARQMELLADELNDQDCILDDGELEGSGDDYEEE